MTKKQPSFFPRTDSGNGELLAVVYGKNVRFDHKQQRWLIWDKRRGRWLVDKEETVRMR